MCIRDRHNPIIKPHFIETSRLDIGDKKKDAAKLMMYASKLGVEKLSLIHI